jgi:hypothetical protein
MGNKSVNTISEMLSRIKELNRECHTVTDKVCGTLSRRMPYAERVTCDIDHDGITMCHVMMNGYVYDIPLSATAFFGDGDIPYTEFIRDWLYWGLRGLSRTEMDNMLYGRLPSTVSFCGMTQDMFPVMKFHDEITGRYAETDIYGFIDACMDTSRHEYFFVRFLRNDMDFKKLFGIVR